ncbi:hypothetical protein pb186bvf_000009 [Paramecium bursaria]
MILASILVKSLDFICRLYQFGKINIIFKIQKQKSQLFFAIMQNTVKIGHYNYDELNCLGSGAYGKVYEGVNTLTQEIVAVKKLDLELFEKDKYLRKQIIHEIEIISKLNHINIVHFIELLSTKKSLFIITEMCRNGDLKQLISQKNISEQQAIGIMRQILCGFQELVKNGVIHRDMKPANVLNDKGVVKIADFGFAKYVENYSSQLLKSCVGSPLYMAPQVLSKQHYSTKCDIWSLGVIFYEMLFFDVPWKGRDEDDLLNNIYTKQYAIKKPIGEFSEKFLKMTLAVDEEERATWSQLFEMFQNITNIEIPDEDINEESIQKVPTWIQKGNSNKLDYTEQDANTMISELVHQREIVSKTHFYLVESNTTQQIVYSEQDYYSTTYMQQFIQNIGEQLIQDYQNIMNKFSELSSRYQPVKNLQWKVQEQMTLEQNYAILLLDDFIKIQGRQIMNDDIQKVKSKIIEQLEYLGKQIDRDVKSLKFFKELLN